MPVTDEDLARIEQEYAAYIGRVGNGVQSRECDWWVAEFSLANESRHAMVLQGGNNKAKIEQGLYRFMMAHRNAFPHLELKFLSLVRLDSPTQVDEIKNRIRDKNPRQFFADEIYPENPNHILFKPLTLNDEAGRGEEALLRFLCEGNWK